MLELEVSLIHYRVRLHGCTYPYRRSRYSQFKKLLCTLTFWGVLEDIKGLTKGRLFIFLSNFLSHTFWVQKAGLDLPGLADLPCWYGPCWCVPQQHKRKCANRVRIVPSSVPRTFAVF